MQEGGLEISRIDEAMRPQYDVIKHKKTYTEDAPLFGKLVGTFTWREYKRREPKKEAQNDTH